MIEKVYLYILSMLIDFIDKKKKMQINNFFLKKIKNKKILLIDIGAHKGETIKQFSDNFSIKKIYAIEPNPEIFKELKKKFISEKISFFNYAIGEKDSIKYLNILNDSSSSTIVNLNYKSKYFQRKKRLLTLFSNKLIKKKKRVLVYSLNNFLKKNKINFVDILKIDTEGYEFTILKSILKKNFKKIKYIYFEHHYDLMLKKNYKFNNVNKLLKKNNFKMAYKNKMNCRKTFEYIYEKI